MPIERITLNPAVVGAMFVSRSTILFALVILALSTAGCDPGYRYQHVDAQGQWSPEWSETVAGVRFSVRPYSTLIGSGSTSVNLDIANESEIEVVVLSGQLVTKGQTIDAHIFDGPLDCEARIVPAGESKSVSLSWEFGDAAYEVLGPELTWVWRVMIDKTEHTLRVSMQRRRR